MQLKPLLKCQRCEKEFKPRHLSISKNLFCSRECSAETRKQRVEKECSYCRKLILVRPSLVRPKNFCNNVCRVKENRANPIGYKNGISTYRRNAIKKYGSHCSNPSCKIKKIYKQIPLYMLDVDHKDGDRSNNHIDNLQVWCVWCHALKTRKDKGLKQLKEYLHKKYHFLKDEPYV